MIAASGARVRALIANAWLGDPDGAPTPPRVLDSITLRPHQIEAARRLARAIGELGGALLADDVGLGKTYTALSVASGAKRPLVVAPAALRDMWRAALAATGVSAPVVSFEALSRAGDASALASDAGPDFVIVDEAHHARNPATRRYRALARIVEHARVLLLSATPIHNRRADLDALLALFMGSAAYAIDERELARVVVRRDRIALARADAGAALVPRVAPVVWLRPPADDSVPDALLALPPPLPPRDGGDGGALVALGLVRQWASSDAALRAAVARRLAAAAALADSLAHGRHPTRGDLRAWVVGTDAVQLAFAELLVERATDEGCEELLAAVHRHEDALRALDGRLRAGDGAADDARAALVADVVTRHRGEKVVAFASYAETVAAHYRRLRHTTRVAALTAAGAGVAGGRITRREALARFAPLASGTSPPGAAYAVDLLLATDLLSEGVNLQDASVVIHLDLPWTPARLAQRVGRAARIGAPHRAVAVYAMAPPATAECALRVQSRLREKARVAGVTLGVGDDPFASSPDGAATRASAPTDVEHVRETMRRWIATGAGSSPSSTDANDANDALVAAVRARRDGFLALCTVDGEPCLLASFGGAVPTDAPSALREATELAGGADVVANDERSRAALAALRQWASSRAAASDAGVGDAGGGCGGCGGTARRRVLDRIAAVAHRAPPHRRAAVAHACRDARRAALLPLGAAGESRLAALARCDLPDAEWLEALSAFAREHGAVGAGPGAPLSPGLHPVAILHFIAET